MARRTLKRGMSGPDVKKLQEILAYNLGLLSPADITGHFGPKTERAVKEFQSDYGLKVDGIVGPKTWAALDDAVYTVEEEKKEKTLGKGLSNFIKHLTETAKTGLGIWRQVEEIRLMSKKAVTPTMKNGKVEIIVPTAPRRRPRRPGVVVEEKPMLAKVMPILTLAGVIFVVVYIIAKRT